MTGIETAVVAEDPAALAEFYRTVFDLEEEWVVELDTPAFESVGLGSPCVVRCLRAGDGHRLKFAGPARQPAAETGSPVIIGVAGRVMLSMVVTDLEKAVSRIVAAGGTDYGDGAVLQPRPTARLAFLRDPEGNGIELIERHTT